MKPPDFHTENDTRVGLDAKVVLKDAFTLDVALNPDFSQVESDEPQVTVNQRYEVFFPEKRPFFIEGSEIFQFTGGTSGGQLFYTRRIGRSPQTRPPTPESDVPTETTILGAVKVSGRTAGWSIGTLTV